MPRHFCDFWEFSVPVFLIYHFPDIFVNRKSFSFAVGADFRTYDPL